MEIIKLGILAIVQGITELLPISSSGHLIILGNFFSIDTDTLLLSVFHFGTTLAIILFFWRELFKDLFTKKKLNFYLKILISTIPAAIVGVFFQEIIENYLRATWIIGISLIVWGIVMVILDQREEREKDINLENISWKQSLMMGFAQIFALIPGTSRSGITTIAGILGGLDKYRALEYSFILGIPILLGSSMYEISKSILFLEGGVTSTIISASLVKILVVAIVPFVIGYISLLILKRFKKKNWLTVFGAYRIFLGSLILLCLL
jgi:undecaprenyl-diphosphatase